MRLSRSTVLAPGIALAIAVAARAEPDAAARVLDAIQKHASDREPVHGALAEIARLPDFDLDRAGIEALVARAGIPSGSILDGLIANARTITKRGDVLSLSNGKEAGFPIGGATKAWAWVGKEVQLKIHPEGSDVVLDGIDGIDLSEKKDSSHWGLHKATVGHKNGRPNLELKIGPFGTTRDVDLGMIGAKKQPPPPPGAPTAGVVGALSNADAGKTEAPKTEPPKTEAPKTEAPKPQPTQMDAPPRQDVPRQGPPPRRDLRAELEDPGLPPPCGSRKS